MQDNIFAALRESHERQRSYMRKLLRAKPGARRDEMFRELRIELAAHEAAEERYLYVHILMDDRGLAPSRDALADHHEMDEIVEDLQGRRHGEAGWMNTVRKLSRKLHEHLREEETIFFQMAGKILGGARKKKLAAGYRRNFHEMELKLSENGPAT